MSDAVHGAMISHMRVAPLYTLICPRLVFGGSRDYPSGVWLSGVGRHNDFDVGTGLDDQAIFITLLSRQRQQICTVVSSDNLQILTTVGEWAIANKPLTPSSVDIKQHTYQIVRLMKIFPTSIYRHGEQPHMYRHPKPQQI